MRLKCIKDHPRGGVKKGELNNFPQFTHRDQVPMYLREFYELEPAKKAEVKPKPAAKKATKKDDN